MANVYDVVTFGDNCVDLVLTDRDITPVFGQKEKIIEDYTLEMGGSTCIFASQTAKLGLNTAVIGKVGRDELGKIINDTLKSVNVITDFIKEDAQTKTGLSVILNKIIDRGILTYNGTITSASIDDFDESLFSRTRHLHIGSYFLMKDLQKHYPYLIDRLKENGTTISLDTNWDPEEKWQSGFWELLPKVDIFLPNENEIMAITQEDTVEKAVKKIKDKVPIIAVKMGKSGALACYKDKKFFAESLEMPVIDTVGAGDSFDGGFIYSMLKGYDIEECLKIACICGSYNVRAHGGIKGQAKISDISAIAASKYRINI